MHGDAFGNEWNIGTLVAVATVRDRREVGRIGFEQYAVDSYFGQYGWHLRPLECGYAVYAEVEIAIAAYAFHVIGCAAKAVEHAARQLLEAVENFKHLVESVAAMYYDWQIAA